MYRKISLLLVLAVLASMVMACTAPAAPATSDAAAPAAASGAPGVCIVRPTTDEPRWVQDKARFKAEST